MRCRVSRIELHSHNTWERGSTRLSRVQSRHMMNGLGGGCFGEHIRARIGGDHMHVVKLSPVVLQDRRVSHMLLRGSQKLKYNPPRWLPSPVPRREE